jgi:hypothetical protein
MARSQICGIANPEAERSERQPVGPSRAHRKLGGEGEATRRAWDQGEANRPTTHKGRPGIPLGCIVLCVGFRRCRCAQPPANGFHASGMTEEG